MNNFGPQAYPIKPAHALMAALFYLAINFVIAPISIIYGGALAAFLIWMAKPEYLPALLILQVNRSNFLLSDYGTWEHSVQRFYDNAIVIAGIPISITYVVAATVFLRVVWELAHRPETFRRCGLSWLFIPWVIGLFLAAIMTFQAFIIRNPSWTLNIRVFLLLGCIFYGAILMRSWRGSGVWLVQWMVPIIGVFCWLAAIGRFHEQVLWVFTGMAIPLSWMAFRMPNLLFKASGLFCATGAVFYASGLGPGITSVGVNSELAGGFFGTGSSSFTLNALLLVSILVAVVAALPKGNFRTYVAWFFGYPAFVTIFVFSFGIAILSPRYQNLGSAGWTLSRSEMTPVERFQSKMFDDRSIIWHGALKDALSGDYILRPAGSPIIINHPRFGSMVWQPGAHNSFFEALRAHRWVGGSIVILFILIVMQRCAQVVGKPVPTSLRATAAGIIAVSIISNTAGSTPISGEGSFWYFTFSGVIIAAIAEVKYRAANAEKFSSRFIESSEANPPLLGSPVSGRGIAYRR